MSADVRADFLAQVERVDTFNFTTATPFRASYCHRGLSSCNLSPT